MGKNLYVAMFACFAVTMIEANNSPWTPTEWEGDDNLLCNEFVCITQNTFGICCACNSRSSWELDKLI